jgi:L-lysine 2,3-aminomutase
MSDSNSPDHPSRADAFLSVRDHRYDRQDITPQRLVDGNAGGASDPCVRTGNSPFEGLVRKYELSLIYVASPSAHCCFCHREELIPDSAMQCPGGVIAPKGLARIEKAVVHAGELKTLGRADADPMLSSNRKLAQWLSARAEAGIEQIRIGTRALAFLPDRFDAELMSMLDRFHAIYPRVQLRFMMHFDHPAEFLVTDAAGAYVDDPRGGFVCVHRIEDALAELRDRDWIGIDNQALIVEGINRDTDTLRIMQRELRRRGVQTHYFLCGRDIVGRKASEEPFGEAWRTLEESQKGLFGLQRHAHVSITHYRGKTEVVAVTSRPIREVPWSGTGAVIFKMLSRAKRVPDQGKAVIAGCNSRGIWAGADSVIDGELGPAHKDIALELEGQGQVA